MWGGGAYVSYENGFRSFTESDVAPKQYKEVGAVMTVFTIVTGNTDTVLSFLFERLPWSGAAVIVGAVLGGMFFLSPLFAGGVAAIGVVGCWAWFIKRDFVSAFTAFIAFLPLWTYFQVVQWPPIPVPGTKAYAITLAKEVFLAIAFVIWLSTIESKQDRLLFPKQLFGYLVLVVVFVTATATRPLGIPLALRPYVEMFVLAAVPLLATSISRSDIEQLLIGFLVAGGVFAVIALLNAFVDPTLLLDSSIIREELFKGSGPPAYLNGRLQSITANPNDLGQTMVLTSIIAIWFLYGQKYNVHQQGLIVTLLALSLLVLMLSRSRDDIGLLGVGLVLFLVMFREIKTTFAVVSLTVLGFLYNLDQIRFVFKRLLSRGNPRFGKWLDAAEFYGVGIVLGGNRPSQIPNMGTLDSSYMVLLVEVGLIGLIMFLIFNAGLLSGLLYYAKREQDHLTAIIAIGLLSLLGTFTFRNTLFSFPIAFYYWVFVALGISLLYTYQDSVT
jgi:hypothetical protein